MSYSVCMRCGFQQRRSTKCSHGMGSITCQLASGLVTSRSVTIVLFRAIECRWLYQPWKALTLCGWGDSRIGVSTIFSACRDDSEEDTPDGQADRDHPS